jgi:hypothetical protein
MTSRLLVLILSLYALSSCSGGADERNINSITDVHFNRVFAAQNLCSLHKLPNPPVIATQIITGSIVYGNVQNTAQFGAPTMFTSMYGTLKGNLRWRGIDHDASGLVGIGRSADEEEAKRIAENQCNILVDNWINQINFPVKLDYTLGCEEIQTVKC